MALVGQEPKKELDGEQKTSMLSPLSLHTVKGRVWIRTANGLLRVLQALNSVSGLGFSLSEGCIGFYPASFHSLVLLLCLHGYSLEVRPGFSSL